MQTLKKIFVLALLLTPLFLQAQNLKSLDFVISPEYSWRLLSPAGDPTALIRDKTERPGVGLRTGVYYNVFNRNQTAAFRLGLLYTNTGYRVKQETPNVTNHWTALEIPALLRFYGNDRKCASFVDIGPAIHLRSGKNIPKNEKILYSANFGFGFNWLFQENKAIFWQPNLRYYLTPIKSAHLKENRLSVGFEMGIRTYFR
jgi:hypothetical protein